jgi:hypothetical protein
VTPSQRWAGTVFIASALVLGLMAIYRPWTRAELQLSVDQLQIQPIDDMRAFLSGHHFETVLLTNFSRIEAPSAGAQFERTETWARARLTDLTVASFSASPLARLTIAAPSSGVLKVTTDRGVSVVFTAGSRSRFTAQGWGSLEGTGVFSGDSILSSGGAASQSIVASAKDGPAILAVTIRDTADLDVENLPIAESVSFETTSEARSVSLIRSASIRMPALEDDFIAFAPNSIIRFDHARNVRIRKLRTTQPLTVLIGGEFKKLTVGDVGALHNYIPTMLQQAATTSPLVIFAAALCSVTSAAWTLLRMFRQES